MEKVCVTKMDWNTILKRILDGDAVWKHKIKSSSTEPVNICTAQILDQVSGRCLIPSSFPSP